MKYIFLLAILSIITTKIFSQELSEFEMLKVKENASNVIVQYSRYLNLIGDVSEPDEDRFVYTKSLLQLFNSENVQVFNDLDPEKKSGEYFDINVYTEYLNLWYTSGGLQTTIDKDSIKFGRAIKIAGNQFFIKARCRKTLSGVYLKKTPNQMNQLLEFQITFDKSDLSFAKFKIVKISLPSTTLPAKAGVIKGKTTVKTGEVVKYDIPAIDGADIYLWTLPNGFKGKSISNSIIAEITPEAEDGTISVKGENDNGAGVESNLKINVSVLIPADAGAIQGKVLVKPDEKNILYMIPEIEFAQTYEWTLPTGFKGVSTTNTIRVDVTNDAESGIITVKAKNKKGEGKPAIFNVSLDVPLPADAGKIAGNATVYNGSSVIFSIDAIQSAISYIWTLPDGFEGTSSTNQIALKISPAAKSGTIAVQGKNKGGKGKASSLFINVEKPLPLDAGIISGAKTVNINAQNQIYTIPEINNATSYEWSIDGDAKGNSSTNSISINFGDNQSIVKLSVKGKNNYGDGKATTLVIRVIGAKKFETCFYITGGQTTFAQSIDNTTNQNSLSYGAGFSLSYHITKNLIIKTGIEYIMANNTIDMTTYTDSTAAVDSDNDSYIKRINGNNLVEKQSYSFLNIPVAVGMQLPVSPKFAFYIEAGAIFSMSVNKTYTGSGIFSYKGYYPQYNVEIANFEPAGFINDAAVSQNGTVTIKPIYTIISAAVGFQYSITPLTGFRFGVNYRNTLGSIVNAVQSNYVISNDTNTFNSLSGKSTKSTFSDIGVELGFVFKF